MTSTDYSGGFSIDEVRHKVKTDQIYKLSSNENPLGPSPRVIEAIHQAAATLNYYPPRNDDRFRAALADLHGRGLTADHFYTANSGSEVLEFVARAFLRPGDEVIISSPTFGVYAKNAKLQEAIIVDVPLKPNDFSLDVAGILAAVTAQTRLIYICNPNNPTGAMIPAADMDRLVASLPERTLIVVDEVYWHYVNRDDFPDSMGYVLTGKNVVIVQSFSKAYGLAGLRLGFGITTPALAQEIRRYWRTFHLSELHQQAGLAALADQAHLQKVVNITLEGKRYLYQQLTQLGVKYWPSEGNFILIQPNLPTEQVEAQLLERGIMVRPTESNGFPGGLRVTVGLPEANQAFINALRETIKEQ